MHDFTKQELETLYNNFDTLLTVNPESDGTYELMSKIKSMIDNFCEHEYITILVNSDNEPFIDGCMKCYDLRMFNDN